MATVTVRRSMKVVLTLVVRDEADVIDAQIAFHLNAGVDFVVAVDHDSEDGTTEILRTWEREGHLRRIPRSGPFQEIEWRTSLARMAASDFGGRLGHQRRRRPLLVAARRGPQGSPRRGAQPLRGRPFRRPGLRRASGRRRPFRRADDGSARGDGADQRAGEHVSAAWSHRAPCGSPAFVSREAGTPSRASRFARSGPGTRWRCCTFPGARPPSSHARLGTGISRVTWRQVHISRPPTTTTRTAPSRRVECSGTMRGSPWTTTSSVAGSRAVCS